MKYPTFKPVLAALIAFAATLTPAMAEVTRNEAVPVAHKSEAELHQGAKLSHVLKRTDSYETNPNKLHAVYEGQVALPRQIRQLHLNRSAAADPIAYRSLATPRGNIYGVCSNFQGLNTYADCFWGKIDLQSGKVAHQFTNSAFYDDTEQLQTCAVRNGILYVPKAYEDMVTFDVNIYWECFDLATGERLEPINFNTSLILYSLTYDSRRDRFFGLALDPKTGLYGCLVTINPKDWSMREVGSIDAQGNVNPTNVGGEQGNFMGNICYNPDDNRLYGMKDDGVLYQISATSGATAKVAQIPAEMAEYVMPIYSYSNPLVYSPLDHAFVLYYNDFVEMATKMFFIETESGMYDVVEGVTLDGGYMFSNFYCPDEYANDAAPAAPEVLNVNFPGTDLDGSIIFKFPDTTYADLVLNTDLVKVEIQVDGETVYEKHADPGTVEELKLTVTEGEHTAVLRATANNLTGPAQIIDFYAGNDVPFAPTKVAYTDGVITWVAPGDVGVHDGFIDVEDLTYDVYFDGEKQNAEPLKECRYEATNIADLDFARRNITVVATAHGVSSQPSNVVEAVFGAAMTLPVTIAPTAEEFSMCQTLNIEYGTAGFEFDADTNEVLLEEMYYNTPNDWVFLPLINFPTADHLYQLDFKYRNTYDGNPDHYNDLEVYIGSKAEVAAMTAKIYSHEHSQPNGKTSAQALFSITNPGDYYIGFHAHRIGVQSGNRGVRLSDIKVTSRDDATSAVPAAPENVVFKAGDKGALKTTVTMTMPTLDMAGNTIDAKEIIVKIETEGHEATCKGAPGAKASAEIEVNKDGFNIFYVTPSIEGVGAGARQEYRAYVGYDIPSAPANLKCEPTEDNMNMRLTWDPVTVGENGGYVDPATVKYRIYTMEGITAIFHAEVAATDYVIVPAKTRLASLYATVSAVTDNGESQKAAQVHDVIGTPYEVPLTETFPSTAFDCDPWTFKTGTGYLQWVSSSSPSVGNLRYSNGTGGLNCEGEGFGAKTMLYIPKISTVNSKDVNISFTFVDFTGTPELEIWGRRAGHNEYEKILDVDCKRPVVPGFVTWSDALPESYQGCTWVQLAIVGNFKGGNNEGLYIDDITVGQDVEHDMKVSTVEAPYTVNIGETPTFYTTVINSGTEANAGKLAVELLGDGKVVDRMEYSVRRITSGTSYLNATQFEMKVDYAKYSKMEVRSTITAAKDMIVGNNTRSATFNLHRSPLPVVEDLRAEWNDKHDAAVLTWSEPTAEYGEYDSFEAMVPFRKNDKLGQWQNIDKDGKDPFWLDIRFEGDELPTAWDVINAEDMGLMDDERLFPHSGKQYLMARCPGFDEYTVEDEKDVPWADDWLISPEIVGGTRVTFWMNTISSGYTETIELWYSTTDTNIESFKRVRPFTKSGADAWEECSAMLPEDAKYFALRYYSQGKFGVMIDDIELTLKELSKWDISHYSVYALENNDWETFNLIADNVKETGYVHECNDANRSYFVITHVQDGDVLRSGNKSNRANVYQTSVSEVEMLAGVRGGKGKIVAQGYAGEQMAIYTADGKIVKVVTLDSDNAEVAVNAALYIVKIGNAGTAVVVK